MSEAENIIPPNHVDDCGLKKDDTNDSSIIPQDLPADMLLKTSPVDSVPGTHLTFPGSIGFSASQMRNMRAPLLKNYNGSGLGKPKRSPSSSKKKNNILVDDIVECNGTSTEICPKPSLKQKRLAKV